MGEKRADRERPTFPAEAVAPFGFDPAGATALEDLLNLVIQLRGQLQIARQQAADALASILTLTGDTLFDADIIWDLIVAQQERGKWMLHREGFIDPDEQTFSWQLYVRFIMDLLVQKTG